MSEIRATTISDAAGTGPIALTKQSAAKVFCRHTMVSTTAITSSLNVSTVTDNGTGDSTINYTNAFSAADQCVTGGAGDNDASPCIIATMFRASAAATNHRMDVQNDSFGQADRAVNNSIACGDLA